jgi:hypothetical protein
VIAKPFSPATIAKEIARAASRSAAGGGTEP